MLPIVMPIKSEKRTSLRMRANPMAARGGSRESKPGSNVSVTEDLVDPENNKNETVTRRSSAAILFFLMVCL